MLPAKDGDQRKKGKNVARGEDFQRQVSGVVLYLFFLSLLYIAARDPRPPIPQERETSFPRTGSYETLRAFDEPLKK